MAMSSIVEKFPKKKSFIIDGYSKDKLIHHDLCAKRKFLIEESKRKLTIV